MIVISLLEERRNDFSVWVAMKDPRSHSESFCIGSGATEAAAFTDARKALEKATDDLVVLASDHGVTVPR